MFIFTRNKLHSNDHVQCMSPLRVCTNKIFKVTGRICKFLFFQLQLAEMT